VAESPFRGAEDVHDALPASVRAALRATVLGDRMRAPPSSSCSSAAEVDEFDGEEDADLDSTVPVDATGSGAVVVRGDDGADDDEPTVGSERESACSGKGGEPSGGGGGGDDERISAISSAGSSMNERLRGNESEASGGGATLVGTGGSRVAECARCAGSTVSMLSAGGDSAGTPHTVSMSARISLEASLVVGGIQRPAFRSLGRTGATVVRISTRSRSLERAALVGVSTAPGR